VTSYVLILGPDTTLICDSIEAGANVKFESNWIALKKSIRHSGDGSISVKSPSPLDLK
jgi:hypothetical protein